MLLDAGPAGGVHLQHVHVPPLGDRAAGLAGPAGLDRRPALPVRPDAVQPLGDDARRRGLAHPAHAGQHEGMGDAVRLEGVPERPHHRLLADQVGEGLRAGTFGRGRDRRLRRRSRTSDPRGSDSTGPNLCAGRRRDKGCGGCRVAGARDADLASGIGAYRAFLKSGATHRVGCGEKADQVAARPSPRSVRCAFPTPPRVAPPAGRVARASVLC